MAARPGARRRGRGRDDVEREDADREAAGLKSLTPLRLLRALRLLRLVRLTKASRLLQRWENKMALSFSTIDVFSPASAKLKVDWPREWPPKK